MGFHPWGCGDVRLKKYEDTREDILIQGQFCGSQTSASAAFLQQKAKHIFDWKLLRTYIWSAVLQRCENRIREEKYTRRLIRVMRFWCYRTMLKLHWVSYRTDEEVTVVAYFSSEDNKGISMASSLMSTKWLVLWGKRGKEKKPEKEASQKGLVSREWLFYSSVLTVKDERQLWTSFKWKTSSEEEVNTL